MGLIVLFIGIILVVSGIFWPVSIKGVKKRSQRLDDFLNEFQSVEYHESIVRAPVERVLDAAQNLSFADLAVIKFLFRLRALFSKDAEEPNIFQNKPVLEMVTNPDSGFVILDLSDPHELVFGMVGKPWSNETPPRIETPDDFLAFSAPGQMKVASNIKIVEVKPGVVRLSTETRNLGNDADGRKIFARYWGIIYPGSSIVRRIWLNAITAKAKSQNSHPA